MAQNTIVKVRVDELTKFGFKHQGRYVNYSKHLPEADKTKVVPGAEFEAEFYVADSGKEYLNKVIGKVTPASTNADVPLTKTVDAERAKKFTPKFVKKESGVASDGMSKSEWAAKDVRISRQGCIQAAVQAVAPLVSVELLFTEAVKLANQMLEFVNQTEVK